MLATISMRSCRSPRASAPISRSFADIYADWAVANVLNDPAGCRWALCYTALAAAGRDRAMLRAMPPRPGQQFGVDYYGELNGPLTFSFDGADSVSLTGRADVRAARCGGAIVATTALRR